MYSYGDAVVTPFATSTYAPNEFSFSAIANYRGPRNISTTDPTHTPTIVGDVTNILSTFGLCGGLDISDPTKVQFVAFVYNGAYSFAESVPVDQTVAHYIIVTFANGNLSIYVDALSPVTTTGVAPFIPSGSPIISVGGAGPSGQAGWTGSMIEVNGWNICLTTSEIAQQIAWMKAISGLP